MTRSYQMYLTDGFSEQSFGGNPAAVVIVKEPIRDSEMQKLAAEFKQSETAFIYKLDKDIYQVRFFTPKGEVDLCGHATIATFWTKAKNSYIDPIEEGRKKVTQYTKAGKLDVFLDYKDCEIDKVVMAQPQAEIFGDLKNVDKLIKALNIKEDDLGMENYDLGLPFVSTGIKDLMVPMKSREVLSNLKPNFMLLEELSKEEDFFSYHVYTSENEFKEVYQRNFCPILGIDEESATGTSTGALIGLLSEKNVLKNPEILFIQGIEMNRPSQIYASIENINGKDTILVGGKACILVEGVVHL